MMKISVKTLESVFQLLMGALGETGVVLGSRSPEIEFLYDFYWSVPMGKRHNVLEFIENDIGSIDHDIERLNSCVLDKELNSHHFRYLGNVLIAIADTLEGSDTFI